MAREPAPTARAAGRGRKWTVAELRAIPADWRGDTLRNGDGLVGAVRFIDVGADRKMSHSISMHFVDFIHARVTAMRATAGAASPPAANADRSKRKKTA